MAKHKNILLGTCRQRYAGHDVSGQGGAAHGDDGQRTLVTVVLIVLVHGGEAELVLGDGLAEGQAGTVQAVALRVGQDRHEELGLLPLGGEEPAVGLAEEVEAVDEGNVGPVSLREPLDHLGMALLRIARPSLRMIVSAYHKIIHESAGHFGVLNT